MVFRWLWSYHYIVNVYQTMATKNSPKGSLLNWKSWLPSAKADFGWSLGCPVCWPVFENCEPYTSWKWIPRGKLCNHRIAARKSGQQELTTISLYDNLLSYMHYREIVWIQIGGKLCQLTMLFVDAVWLPVDWEPCLRHHDEKGHIWMKWPFSPQSKHFLQPMRHPEASCCASNYLVNVDHAPAWISGVLEWIQVPLVHCCLYRIVTIELQGRSSIDGRGWWSVPSRGPAERCSSMAGEQLSLQLSHSKWSILLYLTV